MSNGKIDINFEDLIETTSIDAFSDYGTKDPSHWLVQDEEEKKIEEEKLSLDNLKGLAFKALFPTITQAYQLAEPRIKEGVAAATNPWGGTPDILDAQFDVNYYSKELKDARKDYRNYMEQDKVNPSEYSGKIKNIQDIEENLALSKEKRAFTYKDKITRFVKGALGGKNIDYVEEQTEKEFPLEFKRHITHDDVINHKGSGPIKGTGPVDFKATSVHLKHRDDFEKAMRARTDIFRIGLGLPQRYNSMVKSKYKPTEEELEYLQNKYVDGKQSQPYVGQGGWQEDRPAWDFRDESFFGIRRSRDTDELNPPAHHLDEVVRSHGLFINTDEMHKVQQSQKYPMIEVTEEEKEKAYGAFTDVWDFKYFDKRGMGPVDEEGNPAYSLADLMDEIGFYQAPQLYGRRYQKDWNK